MIEFWNTVAVWSLRCILSTKFVLGINVFSKYIENLVSEYKTEEEN